MNFDQVASGAFVTSESNGADQSYRLVFSFRSLDDLSAAHRAWVERTPPAPAAPVSVAVREQLLKMTNAYAKAMKDAGVSYYPEALAIVREARAVLAAVGQSDPRAEAPVNGAAEALKQIRAYCEECFDSDKEVASVADDWRSDMSHVYSIASSALAATQRAEPATGSYVQIVPDKCDRIVWRGRYYHLPLATQQAEPSGCACRWQGDQYVSLCELHQAWKDAIHEWAERAKTAEAALASKEASPSAASPELIAAARAVVARWHTPKWKDEAPTAEFIQRLERALPPSATDRQNREGGE